MTDPFRTVDDVIKHVMNYHWVLVNDEIRFGREEHSFEGRCRRRSVEDNARFLAGVIYAKICLDPKK